MVKPRVCVLRAPGTNCDLETAFAFDACGAQAERLHIFQLLENPARLTDYQMLCVPGGFSYGDDIGAGVILSRQLQGRLSDVLNTFLQRDKLMLGICNGFQALLKAGILPGHADGAVPEKSADRQTTLTWNLNGRYTALWVRLKVYARQNVFLRGLEEIDLPIAHAEGRIQFRHKNIVAEWEQNQQIALKYIPLPCGPAVETTSDDAILPYPHNPNGSLANIAALSNPTGRVLGLMPHPERFLHATQHPHWTRLKMTGEGAGMQLFRNAVEYFS